MIRTKQKAPVKRRGRPPLGTTAEHIAAGRVVVDSTNPDGSVVMRATEDIRIGAKRKPGRPPSGKIHVHLRLDPEVVAKFKAGGPGWQARINDKLKEILK